MNLENVQVVHEKYGEGNIVRQSDSVVEVCFSCGNKKFVYPDAFGTHLTVLDQELAQELAEVKGQVERERLAAEAEAERIRALEEEKRERRLERERLIQSHKLSPASQAVFWCEQEELDEVFSQWQVFTGVRKSGEQKGQPTRLARLHPNSACLITVRDEGLPESERRIVGFFMVEETFLGSMCEDGLITAHPKFRIRLTDEEAEQFPFWKYYYNERYPASITWNSGRHRYFANVWMAQILQDLLDLKEDSERELVQEFLEYFCDLNRLDEDELPAPEGALLRVEQ